MKSNKREEYNGWDEEKPTRMEEMLELVKKGALQIKYTPQLQRKPVFIIVTKQNLKEGSDRINSDIGFFTKNDGSPIAISNASVKSYKLFVQVYK